MSEPDDSIDDSFDAPPAAIGIDLGTTTCAVSRLVDDRVLECYPLEGEQPLMPSVLFVDDEIHSGGKALQRGLDKPDAVVEAFKRDMGEPHFHRKIRHHWVPPEILSAMLLEEIRVRLERQSEEVDSAVITVPAYFDERRRKATLEAGRLAGLNVIDIVNEPVAAALAELHHSGRLDGAADRPMKMMVYDLGGGTFDVSVLDVAWPEVTTLASDGDVRLGGRDFDERIVDYVAEQFQHQHGVDPRSDFGYTQRLWRLAQQAKHELSDREETTVVCSFAGMRLGVEITRRKFEELIEPLLERTIATATDAVEQAGLNWAQLDQVLLVGGSSRIPAVAAKIAQATGVKPTLSHAADLAVSMGAALFAAMGTSKRLKPLKVVNVNAHSLGVAGVNPQTGEPINRIMIPRNSRLPASKRQRFVTKSAGQKTIQVKIVEGENENPNYCVPVGTCIATLSPDLPARTEVIVTTRVSTNGTLSVACVIPLTKEGAHVEIRRDGLLELESLPVWRDRLLRGVTEHEAVTPDLPRVESVTAPDPLDHAQVIKRIDYLCQQIGERCAGSTVPPGVLPAQRQLAGVRREHQAIVHLLDRVRRKLSREADSLERAKLQAAAAAVRAQLGESEQLFLYSRIAFGAACVAAGCAPVGLAAESAEAYELGQRLADWTAANPRAVTG